MRWWLGVCRAASDRWDAWWRDDHHPERDRLSIWWTEPRMHGVEDTGSIVATPEDLAEISPTDPVRMPSQRARHARPKGET